MPVSVYPAMQLRVFLRISSSFVSIVDHSVSYAVRAESSHIQFRLISAFEVSRLYDSGTQCFTEPCDPGIYY